MSRSEVLCLALFPFTKGTVPNSKDDSVSLAIKKNNNLIKISENEDKYSERVLRFSSNYLLDIFCLNQICQKKEQRERNH